MNRLPPASLSASRLLVRRSACAVGSASSCPRFLDILRDQRSQRQQPQRQFRSATRVIKYDRNADQRSKRREGGSGTDFERGGVRGGGVGSGGRRGFDRAEKFDGGGRAAAPTRRNERYELPRQSSPQHQRRPHSENPPVMEKSPINSITIVKDGGAAKYCYGCGATIVSKAEQEAQTKEVVGDGGGGSTPPVRMNKGRHFKNVSMGLKSSAGGRWNQKKKDVEISKIKNWGYCPRCKALQRDNKHCKDPGDSQLEALSPSHEMKQIFGEQVGRIRDRDNAVVVLCVDAVNVHGSLIRSLRNYVGGNPILLAVTRCDLLPEYVAENWTARKKEEVKDFFRRRAAELNPADVYLCSVDDDEDRDAYGLAFDGAEELSDDLLQYLDGRDPYVVGAANIGKSTLTDRLIDEIIAEQAGAIDRYRKQRRSMSEKERKKLRYVRRTDRELAQARYAAVQQSRVTKSSLPGTTLQNVRVPCFPNHTQALWDTPGLLLDQSLGHYPIRDFRRIKARRPGRIVPRWLEVERRSFALLVTENRSNSESKDGDAGEDAGREEQGEEEELPLLRIEIRLKKQDKNPEPVCLVWNSLLSDVLTTDITSIEESQEEERRRMAAAKEAKQHAIEHAEEAGEGGEESEESSTEAASRTPEERARTKEERRRQYEERKAAQIAEMGEYKYGLLQKESRHNRDRLRLQSMALLLVKEEQILAGRVREMNVEHFGSLCMVSPSTDALVRIFAPNKGIRPVVHPPMVVPPQWRDFAMEDGNNEDDGKAKDVATVQYWEKEMDYEEEDYEMEWGGAGQDDEWGRGRDPSVDARFSHHERYNLRHSEKRHRKWSEFSGERIGWKFHEKPHFVKGTFVDGWQEIREDEKVD